MNIDNPYTIGFISSLLTFIVCYCDSKYFNTKRTRTDYLKSSLYVGLVVTVITINIKNNNKELVGKTVNILI